jgi:short-subunit dehydrogenase
MSTFIVDISGKNILITGATGKIGRDLSFFLASCGASLFLLSRSEERLSQLKSDIQSRYDVSVSIWASDMADLGHFSCTVDHLSSMSIDVLIHAAMYRPSQVPNRNHDESTISSIIVNSQASHLLWTKLSQSMSARSGGSLIYIGSIYGECAPSPDLYTGTTMHTEVDYCFIKGGMRLLSRFIASEYGRSNVRSNVIVLGGVESNQPQSFQAAYINKVPLQRMAKLEDLHLPVLMFCSDHSSYITGAELNIDGGFLIR